MAKRALLIGIDHYDNVTGLNGCVADATALRDQLMRNDDGSLNYDCRLYTSPGAVVISRGFLRTQWQQLFDSFTDDIFFYFSGHGTPTQLGGYLVTQDASQEEPGLAMNDLLQLANQSKAREVLLILDCCYSGSLGNPPNLQGGSSIENQAQLRDGVTILAASRPTEVASEVGGHGVFTELVLSAIAGGAADIRGRVSAASIYAYVEQALGPWDQRPLYKSHASKLSPVRICRPAVEDEELRQLPQLFKTADGQYGMNPSFEYTHSSADAANVEIFNKFKKLRNARLLRTVAGDDLYFAALNSRSVELTQLGRFYWQLARNGRI
jgi:hypothetical protein